MSKLKAFLFLSINGYYKGLNEDISWHQHNEEGAAFSEKQLCRGNILLFGSKNICSFVKRHVWLLMPIL